MNDNKMVNDGMYVRGKILDFQEFKSKRGENFFRVRMLLGIDVVDIICPDSPEYRAGLERDKVLSMKVSASIYRDKISYFSNEVIL